MEVSQNWRTIFSPILHLQIIPVSHSPAVLQISGRRSGYYGFSHFLSVTQCPNFAYVFRAFHRISVTRFYILGNAHSPEKISGKIFYSHFIIPVICTRGGAAWTQRTGLDCSCINILLAFPVITYY